MITESEMVTPAAEDVDRRRHVKRPLLAQNEPGHHRDLADKHRGKDEQAPQRGAPEFPDPRRALDGGDGNGQAGSTAEAGSTAGSAELSRESIN